MASTKPIILIVPGGFFSPEPYATVKNLLEQQGHETIVAKLTVCGDLSSKTPASQEWKDMAGKGATDDVNHIHSLLVPLLDQGRKAVIVAHSYGSLPGMLSIEGQTVAERAARGCVGGITAFVSVAGFAYPFRGKNVFGADEDIPLMPYHELEVCNDIYPPTTSVMRLISLVFCRKVFCTSGNKQNRSSSATFRLQLKTLHGRKSTRHRVVKAFF